MREGGRGTGQDGPSTLPLPSPPPHMHALTPRTLAACTH